VTLDELLASAPEALAELTAELFRRADIAMRADKESQLTACLQLGLRAASISHGMARVIDLHTLDSFETLNRAAIEARDLLMHFRFDDKGTREKVGYWFAGAKDSAWTRAPLRQFTCSVTGQGGLAVLLEEADLVSPAQREVREDAPPSRRTAPAAGFREVDAHGVECTS
jgi:hypothetical protein